MYICTHIKVYILPHILEEGRKEEVIKYMDSVVWFHWKKEKRDKANCRNSGDSSRLGPGQRYTMYFSGISDTLVQR